MAAIDLNADLGETVDGLPTADDEAMFAIVSSASIACGGHAGDAESMGEAVARAARYGVAVGAHPSFEDRVGFGRTALIVPPETLLLQVRAQLSELVAAGADVRYVKPHGALYHVISHDRDAARAVTAAVAGLAERLGRAVPMLGLGGAIEAAATDAGLPYHREAFLDRAYTADGGLVARGVPGAVLHDPDIVAARAVRLAVDGAVEAIDGTLVRVDAASLCVHGDTAGSVRIARAVRAALDAVGIEVRPPW